MASFRTSSVFRFTRDFELLKKILRDGIIPNYCEEDLTFGTEDFCVGIPMASFCDIPIMLLDEHTVRYGNYGIALSKEWAIKQGITPIMYVANDVVLKSVFYHYRRNQDTKGGIDQHVKHTEEYPGSSETVVLNSEEEARNRRAEIEHSVNTHIIGYLKKYMGIYKSKPINNYEENEWRFLVPDEGETTWFWKRQDYRDWRFPNGDFKAPKPSPKEALRKWTLHFTYKDISYILVKDDEFRARMMAFIRQIKTIGGNEVYNEDQRDDLICKLITLDQVKRDF